MKERKERKEIHIEKKPLSIWKTGGGERGELDSEKEKKRKEVEDVEDVGGDNKKITASKRYNVDGMKQRSKYLYIHPVPVPSY